MDFSRDASTFTDSPSIAKVLFRPFRAQRNARNWNLNKRIDFPIQDVKGIPNIFCSNSMSVTWQSFPDHHWFFSLYILMTLDPIFKSRLTVGNIRPGEQRVWEAATINIDALIFVG